MIFEELKAGRAQPVDLIFGTDWWTDCDDVAALALLLRAHNRGLIRLRAIGVSSVMRYSAASVKAVCEEQGLGDIPVGLDTGALRSGVFCLYQKKLAAACRTGFSNDACPEAYMLYRKALSEAQGKAVIVDVGFPQIVAELLRSGPDEYSALGGMELVESKVSEVVLMGGRWDKKRAGNIISAPTGRAARPQRISAGIAPCRSRFWATRRAEASSPAASRSRGSPGTLTRPISAPAAGPPGTR